MKKLSYRDREIQRLVDYKEKILGIFDNGLDKNGHEQPHLLPNDQWIENLWVDIREQVRKLDFKKKINWQGRNNLTSSQILCFNIFFPFNTDPSSLNLYFYDLLPEFKRIKTGSMDFEFKDRTLLNEWNPTYVDLFFEWFDQAETLNAMLIEFKYCEASFSGCSNNHRTRCQDYKALYHSLQNCYLKDYHKTKYWDILLDKKGPVNIDLLPKKGPCPFKADLFQIMRNQLLAHQIEKSPYYSRAIFAVMYPLKNEDLQTFSTPYLSINNPIDVWEKLVRKNKSFLKIPLEELLKTIYKNLPDHLTEWRTFMTKKHRF